MTSKAKVEIKPKNIIKGEIGESDFKYIQDTVQNLITIDMVNDKKIYPIANLLKEGLNNEFKKEFIIIVALEPLYYIQYRYKNILILAFDKVSMFFYKPRQIDIPRILDLEKYKEDIDNKFQKYMPCITVSAQQGLTEQDNEWIHRMIEHMAKYFCKNKNDLVNNQPDFETKFITKVRNFMVVIQKEMYWQMIMTKKHQVLVEQLPTEKAIEFNLDFKSVIPQFKQEVKLFMFQRKGQDPSVIQNIVNRKKEFMGFIGLLVLFLSLIMCRGYIPEELLEQDSPFALKQKAQYKNTFARELICPNKQFLLMAMGVMFLSMFFARYFNKWKKRIQTKEKQAEKAYKEKQELTKKKKK